MGKRNLCSSSSISNRVTVPGNKLFVGDIPIHFTEEDIIRVFSDFGEVKDVILLKKKNGRGLSKVVCNLPKINIASFLPYLEP
jgi:RNA recognition motif-containing protein